MGRLTKEIITYVFWDYPKLDFILFCDGPIKGAYHKRKRIELWGSPQHFNMSHNILSKLMGVELACVLVCKKKCYG
jgi:hypothetical protein